MSDKAASHRICCSSRITGWNVRSCHSKQPRESPFVAPERFAFLRRYTLPRNPLVFTVSLSRRNFILAHPGNVETGLSNNNTVDHRFLFECQ